MRPRPGAQRRPLHDPERARLGASIDRLVKQYGLAEGAAVGRLRGFWAEIVGEEVASRSHVVGHHRGQVHVTVDSHALAFELGQVEEKRILAALQEKGPDLWVEHLKVTVREA